MCLNIFALRWAEAGKLAAGEKLGFFRVEGPERVLAEDAATAAALRKRLAAGWCAQVAPRRSICVLLRRHRESALWRRT